MLPTSVIDRMRPGHLMQHYLMASFCYYHQDESPMADATFDRLCSRLLAAYPTLEHPHKYLVTMDDLRAGTCLLRREQFPRVVQYACSNYDALCWSGQMADRLEPLLLPPAPARQRSRTAPTIVPAPVTRRISRRAVPATPVPEPTPTVRRVRRVAR